ncbi:MAG: radical SAM protein, partial [Deltaproteobacteria bacterium]|nr:radical SAM protein [Deltaproteobacteria bacterium]
NAVSWMARHCAENETGELHIAFHGGGEPTMAGELIAGALLQAEQAALDLDLETFYSIGTNGIMKDETRKFLIDNTFDISLSLDGPESFHNRQRPMPGGNSFQEAWKTVEACTEADLPFSIRTTVTSDNVASLPEFTDFIFDNSTCEIIQFEPLYIRGRAAESAPLLPDPEEFVDTLVRCMDIAEEFDGTVVYSGISYPEIRERFCQACSSSICVTPGGAITGCYESAGLEENDPFLFGHIDASGDVKIDDAACQRISTMTTLEEKCSNCIARYHCAGDCPSKMTGQGENKNYRCSINRDLLKKLIIRRLDTAGAERIEFN